MSTIQFDLGGGVKLALPAHVVAQRLIESLQAVHQHHPVAPRPRIGQYLVGQGGIYVGDILGDDGVLYGLIAAQEEDVGEAAWGPIGVLSLSEWDGLSNTSALRESPAAKLAGDYERDGHCDFYLPARRELMVALANVPHLFGKEGRYWTSAPRSDAYAWAVVFEYGYVRDYFRDYEFRVRPFRRFTH